jgi:hypothetical protein
MLEHQIGKNIFKSFKFIINFFLLRIPTTNGDTQLNQIKSLSTSQPSPHLSPTNSKNYQTPPPQQKLEFRAMRELLSDERRAAEAHMSEMQEETSKDRRQSGEKENEKREESPFQQQENAVVQPASPVNLSNDSHEDDERNYEGGSQSEYEEVL